MAELFGKTYNDLGTTSTDLLLKTRGLVKLQIGNKFIDLLKDGKLATDCKFIFEASEVGDADGIYIVDKLVTLVVNGNHIDLNSGGNTYVSFQEEQQTTGELKVQALKNIGFIYNSLGDVTDIKNGVVYIESEHTLYTITNGVPTKFVASLPNKLKKPIIIESDSNINGSLIILGTSLKDSILFNSMSIYDLNISISNNLNISGPYNDIINIKQDSLISKVPITTSSISSSNGGFLLYLTDTESVLIVDRIISDSLKELATILVFPEQYFYESNIISNARKEEDKYYISTLYNNTYKEGDKFCTFISRSNALKLIIMTVHSVSLGVLEVTLDSDLEDTSLLLNRVIFFLNPGMPIPKIDKNGFHIVDGEGNPLSSISKDGIQSLKMNYLDGYAIPENDSSNTISSTEWVLNLLQLEII